MTVRKIVTSSAGRSYDIAVSSGFFSASEPSVKLELLSGVDGGRALAGPMASVQAVLTCLLTVKGSDHVYPSYGTTFLQSCRYGLIQSDYDVITQFSRAVHDTMLFFSANKTFYNQPSDEVVSDISLEYYSLDRTASKLLMLVKVHFAAGTSIDVIAPIKVI